MASLAPSAWSYIKKKKETHTRASPQQGASLETPTLLALLVQKYKYWRREAGGAEGGVDSEAIVASTKVHILTRGGGK